MIKISPQATGQLGPLMIVLTNTYKAKVHKLAFQ